MAESGESAVFDFMMVRAPNTLAPLRQRLRYVADWRLEPQRDVFHVAGEADLRSLVGKSSVAKVVVDAVTAWNGADQEGALAALKESLATFMIARRPLGVAPPAPPPPGLPVEPEVPAVTVEELEDGAYLRMDDILYLLQDRLERLQQQDVVGPLHEVQRVLWAVESDDDVHALDQRLTVALGVSPERYVLGGDSLSERWGRAQSLLYDALYVDYVCTRFTEINLDSLMEALRALHAVQIVALDALVRRLTGKVSAAADQDPLLPEDRAALQRAEVMWPALAGWDLKTAPAGFPLVGSRDDLAELLRVPVTMHQVFARLFWYLRPFNRIRPIGVGDLKIVRQKLVAYLPGEISHIHNVMKGESRGRNHRRKERTEELFQLTGSRTEDGTTENQTTDRFELKSEADTVIKTMLNVNANANVTTSGKIFTQRVTASAGGGFAYNRSSENHIKTAQNFARDVVTKAVERVETKTTSTRSTTKLFETVEHNRQEFENEEGEHISGIYRWLDKKYEAQVYNYGRRTMYEFAIPEPAALWVTGRLLGFEAELDVPQPPREPQEKRLDLGFGASDITVEKYRELAKVYDLSGLPIPAETMTVALTGDAGNGYISGNSVSLQNDWHAVTKTCEVRGIIGYDLERVWVEGHIDYNGQDNANRFTVTVNGVSCKVLDHVHEYWYLPEKFEGNLPAPEGGPLPLTSETISFAFGFRRVGNYGLIASARLRLGSAGREAWQQKVYEVVANVERERVTQVNKEARLAYEAELSTYRNRLSELAGLRLVDLIQGSSDATNRALMDEEIKRACISAITCEFDTDQSDDLLPKTPAMDELQVDLDVTRFEVHDALIRPTDEEQGQNDDGKPKRTTAGFVTSPLPTRLPAANLANTRTNAFLVQFIEQAFEWERISYLFYPYYWAQRKHWLSLMSRVDGLDPTFSAFLRAGMARVLLSVTPGYECAVHHYLLTRQPWQGACEPPVIDDNLFVPLFEEVREQSVDDRDGGVPEGEPWTFIVPTTLVYLHASTTLLPDLEAERKTQEEKEGGNHGTPDAETPTAGEKTAKVEVGDE
ncbi:hypothetical protein PV342_12305 [Streptomyces sp. PA03-3a]|nr:hypothetical protein [Streptomyces sp. PA03-3a]